MGIRETVNRHPKTIATVAVLGLVAAGLLIWNLRDRGTILGTSSDSREFYTIDDGKSWFADSAEKLPPFDHKGKPAYRCRVWTCDDGKTPFVSHLERLNPEAKKKLDGMTWRKALDSAEIQMVEVKRALSGDTGWVDSRSEMGEAIVTPKCPGGQPSEQLRRVLP